jgi:hypothetical protein
MGHKQRLRAGRQEAASHDAIPDGKTDDLDIEILNQPPEAATTTLPEPENDEPLEVLKRQFQELEAERDRERTRAAELETRNREHEAKLQQHSISEFSNQKAVLEQAYTVEELKLKDAKKLYAEALRNGDFDAAADVQTEMLRSTQVMSQYATAYQNLETQEKAPRPAPAPADELETALKTMEPRLASWVREHKDDVLKPERRRIAELADSMAVAKGMKQGSDAYLDFLDEQMGYFSEGNDVSTGTAESTPKPQPKPAQQTSRRAPSAPPSRTSGSTTGGRRGVYLTEDDKRQAQNYGVSNEEYAKWKLQAEKHPNIQDNSNRLHAKFVA